MSNPHPPAMTPAEETAALVAEARECVQHCVKLQDEGRKVAPNEIDHLYGHIHRLANALECQSRELAEARRDSERLRKGLEDITTANDMGQIAVDGGDWEHCSTWARHILHQHHAARQNGGRA